MSYSSSRREFLRTAAITGLGVLAADAAAWAKDKSPNERVQFACIGIEGKGESDSDDAKRLGEIVAICDVDDNKLANAKQRFPNARQFHDYREMLHTMGKSIDAVTVSTPDHHHVHASVLAMSMGKACFTQKPLTHSIWEARRMGDLARKNRVATQMGNQGTASSGLRKNAALVRSGVIGNVTEVHVWTNRPIWPQGGPRPSGETPPPNLHWELWLGPAPKRPYAPNAYHPFSWRGWWDFGTGALGDMACHTMNLPYMALELRNPTSVQAETSGTNHDSYPNWSVIHYQFPANGKRGPLTMVWYDGGKLPPASLLPLESDEKEPSSGSLIIGDKGKLYTPGDYGGGGHFFDTKGEMIEPASLPTVEFPESPGHFEEFIRAIKDPGQPAMSNFPNYSGPLTETVLLGNLAVWADGKKIEWDAHNLRARNAPEVEVIVRPKYRAGYKL